MASDEDLKAAIERNNLDGTAFLFWRDKVVLDLRDLRAAVREAVKAWDSGDSRFLESMDKLRGMVSQ